MLLLLVANQAHAAATNPTPQTLPYTQNFGTATFTTMPTGMAAWQGNGNKTTQAAAESSSPTTDATLTAATASTTTGGIYGYAVSSNARAYIQESSNATNGTNQIAVAINTGSSTTLVVSYQLELINGGVTTQDYGVELMYHSGSDATTAWTAVTGSAITFGAVTTYTTTTLSYTITGLTSNTNYQIRWVTWRPTGSGNSKGIGIDNISITAPSNNANWTNTTTGSWTIGTGSNWSGATGTVYTEGDNVTFGNTTGGTVTLGVNVAPSSMTVSATTGTYSFSGTGSINGSGSLSKSNAGILNLTGLSNGNGYTNGTTVTGGQLVISNDNQLGGTAGAFSIDNATLSTTGSVTLASTRAVTLGATGVTINQSTNPLTFSGTTAVNGPVTISGTGWVALNGATTFATAGSLAIPSGGTVSLGQTAGGTISMASGGSFNGDLLIGSGLRVNFNDAAKTYGGTGTIYFLGSSLGAGNGGAAIVAGAFANSNALISNTSGTTAGIISSPIVLNPANSGNLTGHVNFTAGSITTANYTTASFLSFIGATTGGGMVLNGAISGEGDLFIGNNSKTGGGTGSMSINVANTYVGNTLVNSGGTVLLGVANALPVATNVVFGSLSGAGNTTLDMNGFSQQFASLSDDAAKPSGKNMTITNNGANDVTLTISGSTSPANAFGGVITDGTTKKIALAKSGSNTITLSGTSTFTGGTTITAGTLKLGGSGNILSDAGAVTITGGAFDINAFNETVGVVTLNGGSILNSGADQTKALTGSAFTVSSGSASAVLAGANVTLTKNSDGSASNGTVMLTGANTYTGATAVASGTLRGTGCATSDFTVNDKLFPDTVPAVSVATLSSYADIGTRAPMLAQSVVFGATSQLQTVISSDNTGTAHSTSLSVSSNVVVNAGAQLNIGVSGANPYTSGADITILTSSPTNPSITTTFVLTHDLPPNWKVVYKHTTSGNEVVASGAAGGSSILLLLVGSGSINAADTVAIRVGDAAVTPVKFDAFSATNSGAGVSLVWVAVSEYMNLGFNVYRKSELESDWQKVNTSLIPGRITNPDAMTYRIVDFTASGRYNYKLESISLDGQAEEYAAHCNVVVDELTSFGVAPCELDIETTQTAFVMEAGLRRADQIVQTNMETKGASVSESRTGTVHNVQNIHDSSATSKVELHYALAARYFSFRTPLGAKASTQAVKITYSQPGVLWVPSTQLPTGFDPEKVRAVREGRGLPVLAADASGMLLFGPGYEDDYTKNDAIFLYPHDTAAVPGTPSGAQGLFDTPAVVQTVCSDAAIVNFHDVYFDYGMRPYTFEPWFSQKYLTSGTAQNFEISTPNATDTAATLTVKLWSQTDAAVSPGHSLNASLNGIDVGGVQWSGKGRMFNITFTIPANTLRPGANALVLTTPELPGAPSQVSFLHSLTIAYEKSLNAAAPLQLVANPSAINVVEIMNLPTGNAWVVDARFPDRAVLVGYESRAASNGTYTLRFVSKSGGFGTYWVVPRGLENAPLSITKRTLKPMPQGIQYLSTGPAQFGAGVQPLLMARSKEGLRSTFVDQEQLFDFYNFGRFGPDGIRKAVRAMRPAYLLLLGRTTYDYKNYSGLNVDPMCPAFLVGTSFWEQTTSDSAFGDLGRGYPEVAVGRLPVNDTTELAGSVSHILASTGAPSSGIRAHITADKADANAGDFPAQAAALVSRSSACFWNENYLGVTHANSVDVSNDMTQAATSGHDVLMYIGHGNAVFLGDGAPRILDLNLVQRWTGNVVLLQSTCTANWMAKNVSGYKSIAIQALTQPQGGISASIGTSTYMNSDAAVAFMQKLLANVSIRGTRWGSALMKTQQWAAKLESNSANWYMDLSRTEQLFGDPAMPVFGKEPAQIKQPTTGQF